MEKAELESLLQLPGTLQAILGDYHGPFSLGITKIKNSDNKYQLLLLTTPDFENQSMQNVKLAEKLVPVEIHIDLTTLKPF